jgi:hypothetical protein
MRSRTELIFHVVTVSFTGLGQSEIKNGEDQDMNYRRAIKGRCAIAAILPRFIDC